MPDGNVRVPKNLPVPKPAQIAPVSGPDPDTAAQARRLIPPYGKHTAAIESALQYGEATRPTPGQSAYAPRVGTPEAQSWLSNPDHAAVAWDQIDPIRGLERALGELPEERSYIAGLGAYTLNGFRGLQRSFILDMVALGVTDKLSAAEDIADISARMEATRAGSAPSTERFFAALERAGALEAALLLAGNPDKLGLLVAENAANAGPAVAGGLAGAVLTGGAALPAAAGAFLGGAVTETGAELAAQIAKRKIPLTDSRALLNLFENDEDALREMQAVALRKGVGTAAADALLFGVGSRLAKLGKISKPGSLALETAGEGVSDQVGRGFAEGLDAVSLKEGIVESAAGLGQSSAQAVTSHIWAGGKRKIREAVSAVVKGAEVQKDREAASEAMRVLRESKLYQRAPEATRMLIERLVTRSSQRDGGGRPADVVYLDKEVFDGAAHALGGGGLGGGITTARTPLDTAIALMGEQGGVDAYRDAEASGYIAVPLPAFLGGFKDLGDSDVALLLDNTRFREDGLTVEEYRARRDALEAEIQAAREEAAADAEGQAARDELADIEQEIAGISEQTDLSEQDIEDLNALEERRREIRAEIETAAEERDLAGVFEDAVAEQLEAAGRPAGEARYGAQLLTQGFRGIARLAKRSLDELTDLFPVIIGEGGDASVMLGQPSDGTPPRGSVSFDAPLAEKIATAFRVGFGEQADESTFVHEAGHVFLEMVARLSEAEGAAPGLAESFQAVLAELGVADHADLLAQQKAASASGKAASGPHEKFAGMFLDFLATGKAKNAKIREALRAFRDWIVALYRAQKLNRVPVSPAVESLLQKVMAAGDAASSAMIDFGPEQLSPEAIEALGGEEAVAEIFELYQEAEESAKDSVLAQMMRAEERQKKALRGKAMDEARALARETIEKSAGMAALRQIREDGTKISEASAREALGTDQARFAALSQMDVFADDGQPLASVAASYGYTDPSAFARDIAIAANPDPFVEIEARAAVRTAFPELRTREALRAAARDALDAKALRKAYRQMSQRIATLERQVAEGRGTAREAGRLRRTVGRLAREFKLAPFPQAVDAAVSEQTDSLYAKRTRALNERRLRTVRPGASLAHAQRHTREVNRALKDKDFRRAARAQVKAERAQIDYEIGRDIRTRRDRIVKKLVRLKGKNYQKRLGKARVDRSLESDGRDLGFQAIVNSLLEKLGLKDGPGNENLGVWISEVAQELESLGDPWGYEISQITGKRFTTADIPALSDLNIDELERLSAIIEAIYAKAVELGPGGLVAEGKSFQQIRDEEIIPEIEAAAPIDPESLSNFPEPPGTIKRRVHAFFEGMLTANRKASMLLNQMSGKGTGTEVGKGAEMSGTRKWLQGILAQAVARAGIVERETIAKVFRPAFEILSDWGTKDLHRMVWLEGLGAKISHEQRLYIGMLLGSKTGRDRVLNGFKVNGKLLTEEAIQAIQDSFTENDVAFMNAMFDAHEVMRKRIAKKYRARHGIEPKWIEPEPYAVAGGTVKGGYVTVKYEDQIGFNASMMELGDDARRMAGAAAYTYDGFVNERAAHTGFTPRIDFNVIFAHVRQVTYDLEVRDALILSRRLLNDKAVRAAIQDRHGSAAWKTVDMMHANVAVAGRAQKVPGGEFAAAVHRNVGSAILAMSFIQIPKNFLGLAQTWHAIGLSGILRGTRAWLTSEEGFKEMGEFVRSRSNVMALREDTINTVISETIAYMRGKGKTADFWDRNRFLFITKSQYAIDMITWLGAYSKAMDSTPAGMSPRQAEARAVTAADAVVADTQGNASPADLAAIQQSNDWVRLFTTFMFFSNTSAQFLFNEVRNIRTKGVTAETAARAALTAGIVYIIPSMMEVLIDMVFRGREDWDEEGLDDFLSDSAMNAIQLTLGGIGGAREFAALFEDYNYSGPPGLGAVSAAQEFRRQVGQIFDGGDMDKAFATSAVSLGGYLTGIPSRQLNDTIRGIYAAQEDDIEGLALLRALMFGPPRPAN